jgi:hypothetical protein
MSSANRGVTGGRNRRKRSREPEDDNAAGASSPAGDIRSSPPAYPIQHGGDDDDDVEEDVELALDIDDADEMAEDEDGIDLFANNFERDYKPREDDRYDERDIDDEGDYDDLDVAERRRLEARLNRRDRELARQRRMPAAFLQDEDDEGDSILRLSHDAAVTTMMKMKTKICKTISWKRSSLLRLCKMSRPPAWWNGFLSMPFREPSNENSRPS